jgi:transposase
MSKKKTWSPSLKFKIALEAIKGTRTIAEICQTYQVAPSQVHAWKKQLLEHGAELFDGTSTSHQKKAAQQQAELETSLYKKIGELTVERDFLKKSCAALPLT